MSTELMNEQATTIETMKLPQLIEAASMAASAIGTNIKQLGDVLCEIAKRYGKDGIDIVHEELGISRESIRQFMLVSRGTLHEKLALGVIPYAGAIGQLSIEEQTQVIDEGLPVVFKVGKTYKVKKMKVDDMPTSVRKQVFDGQRIRTESNQKDWLDERDEGIRRAKAKKKANYEIRNGKLIVNAPHTFDAKALISELMNQI